MANKMNFGVGINLYTDKFKKGVKDVNNRFKTIKLEVSSMAAALGAGSLGLAAFFSKATETVRALDKAQTSLRNVTGDTVSYNDALKFISDTSKKYNQDIIDLTTNYSKLVASSKGTGMALNDVKGIFEGLTQASTYFNLSQDETNGVMLALSQMMSKGKIQAEELRGQLGERLPGALGIMARALGVTQGELDKLMKDGKLIAKDVLPLFGEQLKIETAGFDPNTIEGNIKRIKNMWTNLWKSPDVISAFRTLTDLIADAMQFAANNIKTIFGITIGVMVSYATNAMNKMLTQFEANQQMLAGRYRTITGGTAAKLNNYGSIDVADVKVKDLGSQVNNQLFKDGKTFNERLENAKRLIDELGTKTENDGLFEFDTKVGQRTDLTKKQIQELQEHQRKLNSLVDEYAYKYRALNVEAGGHIETIAKQVTITDQTTKKTNKLSSAWQLVTSNVSSFGRYLKDILVSNLPGLIVGGIVMIGMAIKDAFDEAKRLKNLTKDSLNEITSAKGESAKLKAAKEYLKTYQDSKKSIKEQQAALEAINKLLGKSGADKLKNEKEVTEEIKRQGAQILRNARIAKAAEKIADLESRNNELIAEKNKISERVGSGNSSGLNVAWQGLKKLSGFGSDIDKLDKEIAANKAAISAINASYGGLIAEKTLEEAEAGGQTGGGSTELKGFAKIKADYLEAEKKLQGQELNGILTKEEHAKALSELSEKTRENIAELGKLTPKQKEFFDQLKTQVIQNKPNLYTDAINDFEKEHKKLSNQYGNGVISVEEFNDSMQSLYETTIKTIGALDGLTDEQKNNLEALKIQKDAYQKADMAEESIFTTSKLQTRDKTFDYKLSKEEIKAADLEIKITNAKAVYDDLKAKATETAQDLSNELNNALANVNSLEEALKLQQVKNDIDDLQGKLISTFYEDIQGLAGSTDRLISSVKTLREVFGEESDASGWEKFMAVFNVLTQTISTLTSAFNLFNNLMQISSTIAAATSVATSTAKTTEAGVIVAANQAIAQSNAVVARTGAISAAASVPFPGNIAALATSYGVVEGMLALSNLPMFKDGGIVGGGSFTGDKVLARVNSGEMILNAGQQGRLFKALNGNGLNSNGSSLSIGVDKIKGSDLYLTLSNYMKKTNKTLK